MRATTRLPSTVVFAGLACGLALANPALAQSPIAPTPLERAAYGVPGAEKAAQKYDGVVPGPAGKNPLPAAPQGGVYLVWTGFQMTANGSQVFLQTTRPVEVDTQEGRKSGKAMAVMLRNCRIHMANNRRKIDTRFFATPVSAISARQKGRDVEVRIALREPVTSTPRSEAGPDGSQFVVLDFPPGKAATEASALQDLAGAADAQDRQGDEGASGTTAGKVRLKAAAKSSE